MERRNLRFIRANAYRILGLTAGADQPQIEAAARMMRLLADSDVPPTPNDTPWLGPVPRAVKDIEHALMRLCEPASRVEERLWWFCGQPPATAQDLMAARPDVVTERHDAALLACLHLLGRDPAASDLDAWDDVLHEFRDAAGNGRYRQWSLDLERDGNFEKHVDAAEMARLHDEALGTSIFIIEDLAELFLTQAAFAHACRCVAILRGMSGGVAGPEARAATAILDRLEAELSARCNDCRQRVDQAWKLRRIATLKPALKQVVQEWHDSLEALSENILKWSDLDDSRRDRVAATVVRIFWHVADAYEACHDKWNAREALRLVLPASTGTIAQARLQRRIEAMGDIRRESLPASPQKQSLRGWPVVAVLAALVGIISGLNRNDVHDAFRPVDNSYLQDPEVLQRNMEQIERDLATQPAGTRDSPIDRILHPERYTTPATDPSATDPSALIQRYLEENQAANAAPASSPATLPSPRLGQ